MTKPAAKGWRSTLFLVAAIGGTSLLLGSAPRDADPELPGWAEWVAPVLDAGRGLAVFPGDVSAGTVVAVRDPGPFTVRLVSLDRPRDERVRPAGVPQPPPAGRWRFWVEGDWEISPYSAIAVFPSPGGWRAVQPHILPAGPGGRVRAAERSGAARSGDLELWAVHGGLPAAGGPYGQVSRRVPLREAADGVLMPEGPALAGLWNPTAGRYEALTRPFDIPPGRAVEAPFLRPPEGRSFLLVELSPAPGDPGRGAGDVELLAFRGETAVRPDEQVDTPETRYALWLDLEPGPVRVSGGGERSYLPPVELTLEDGGIGHVAVALSPRPRLDVSLVLPPSLRHAPLSLAVLRTQGGEMLAEAELGPQQSRWTFLLVHDEVTVELRTGFGTYRKVVDLTRETEAAVVLEPEMIRITGEVLFDGEPARARVRLHTTDRHTLEAETDEAGAFEALALRPVFWGAVHLEGETGEPWMETWMPPISADRHLELDIPDARVTVRVIDATSGRPVPGAKVAVAAYYRPWDPEDDPGSEERPDRKMGRTFSTDDQGIAALPPPRPGRLEITASADNYLPTPAPLVLPIPDPPTDQELLLRLEPVGEGRSIQLLLPDGGPAAGAELLGMRGGLPDLPALPLRTDAEGRVSVPLGAGLTHLLVRHPQAAARVLPWPPAATERSRWVLEPPSPAPLRLRVLEPGGEEPAAMARPTLWLDSIPVSGPDLRWLLGTAPFTDPGGHWLATGLPARPLRVLVTGRGSDRDLQAFPNLGTEIPYPWPAVVELRAIR